MLLDWLWGWRQRQELVPPGFLSLKLGLLRWEGLWRIVFGDCRQGSVSSIRSCSYL